MLLNVAGVDGLALWVDAWGDHVGTLVHVGEKESWRNGGAIVEARATIAVPTSANFEIERTIHTVLLCAEDRS